MSNPYLPNSPLVQYPTAELNKFSEFINNIYANEGIAAIVRHVDLTSQMSNNGALAAYPLEDLFEAMTFEEPTDSTAEPQLSIRYRRTLNDLAKTGMDTHVKPYLATTLETTKVLSLESLDPHQVFLLHVFAIEPCKNVNLLTVPREWYSHVNSVFKETLEETLPAVNFNIKTVVSYNDTVRIGNPSEYNQGEDNRLPNFPPEEEAPAWQPVVSQPANPRIDSPWQEPPQMGFSSSLRPNPRPTIDLELIDPRLRGPAVSQYIHNQSLAAAGSRGLSLPVPTLPGPRPSPIPQPPTYQGLSGPRSGSNPQPSIYPPPSGPRPSQAFQPSTYQELFDPRYSPAHQPPTYPARSGLRPSSTPLPPTYPAHSGHRSSHIPMPSTYQMPSGYSTSSTSQPSTYPALSGPRPGFNPIAPTYPTPFVPLPSSTPLPAMPYGPGPSHMPQPLTYPALSGPRRSPGPQIPTYPVLSDLRPSSSPQPRTSPALSGPSTSSNPMPKTYEEFFSAPSSLNRQPPTSQAPAIPKTLPAALPGYSSAPTGVSASVSVGSNPIYPQPWTYSGMPSSSTATSPLVPQSAPEPKFPYDITMPRCQSCIDFKKGCDRMRPCQNCSRRGKSADECIPEPASNAINGKYGIGSGYRTEKWTKRPGGGSGGGSAGAIA